MQRPTVVIVLLMMIVLTSRIELKPRTLVQPEVAAGAAATATHLHGFSDPQQSLKEKVRAFLIFYVLISPFAFLFNKLTYKWSLTITLIGVLRHHQISAVYHPIIAPGY